MVGASVLRAGPRVAGYAINEVVVWSGLRNQWVAVVQQPTGRRLPEGVVELPLDQAVGLQRGVGMQPQGWCYNATTGKLDPADWGEWPAICTLQQGDRIFEITFWSGELSRWIVLVAKPTGRQCPVGTVEIGIDDVARIEREVGAGLDLLAAVQKVMAAGAAT